MVPTRNPGYKRRRIKFNAVAVARFQIEEIIDDGIMIPTRPSFIRARVSLLKDEPFSDDKDSNNLANLEKEVGDKILAKERSQEKVGHTAALVDQVLSLAAIDGHSPKAHRIEAFSFAAAKALCSEVPSQHLMQHLLQITNAEERLKRLLEWR